MTLQAGIDNREPENPAWLGRFFPRRSGWWPLLAFALLLALTHTTSMNSTFDSLRYANSAHWINEGKGLSTSMIVVPRQDQSPEVEPGVHAMTVQPPGLSLFYAAVGVENRVGAHRLLHLLCFGLVAYLVFQLVAVNLSGSPGADSSAYWIGALTLTSPVLLQIVSTLWTDLPFMTFFLGALLAVIRANEPDRRWWVWLPIASMLAAGAIMLRYLGLGIGLVFLLDAAVNGCRGNCRSGRRHGGLRFLLGMSVFGSVSAWLLLRNILLVSSYTGSCPCSSLLAPEVNLVRGMSILGSRVFQALSPGFVFDSLNDFISTSFSGSAELILPLIVFLLLALTLIIRRKDFATMPALLTLAAVLGYTLPLLNSSAHHDEIRVIEARYFAPIVPLLWIPIVRFLSGHRRRRLGAIVLSLIFGVYCYGAFVYSHEVRTVSPAGHAAAKWVIANLPADAPVFTNRGSALLTEDITRRVYHFSDWQYKNALPENLRGEDGLLQYLHSHGIKYVVLFGGVDDRKREYWGDFICSLFTRSHWRDQLIFTGHNIRVYELTTKARP